MANLKSLSAIVVSVILADKLGNPLMKTRADGSQAPYALCNLKLTEGPASGKTLTAQRSLVNRDGVAKENVAVGDEVFATLTSVVTNRETGKPMPMFEVTTSANASNEELLEIFGNVVETTTTATVEEVAIPLAQ